MRRSPRLVVSASSTSASRVGNGDSPCARERTDASSDAAVPFLERKGALATLEEALTTSLAGSGRIALVAGEAGIGKTTLVRELEEHARDRVRVVTGACEALFTPRPLGPIHDLARVVGGRLLATHCGQRVAHPRQAPWGGRP
ncbi:MAG: AAA family ATPase [Gaiella sp.]|nr:AAA family ATPase [Gaiella sp.]